MIIIALGANRQGPPGTPAASFRAALASLPAFGLYVRSCSPFYRSRPQGDNLNQLKGDFLNAAAQIDAQCSPAQLLSRLKKIEKRFRRNPSLSPNRPLDLDIIDFHGRISSQTTLTLPHPRAHLRLFVLAPIADIAPDWIHPLHHAHVQRLIRQVPKQPFPLLSAATQR